MRRLKKEIRKIESDLANQPKQNALQKIFFSPSEDVLLLRKRLESLKKAEKIVGS